MGSSTEGSTAAQGAPEADPDQGRSGGIFTRLLRRAASLAGEGDNAESEAEIAENATAGLRKLDTLRVDDVAIPKVDIISAPETIGRQDLVDLFREHGFSRIPVYSGTLDQPLGVVTLKDFALNFAFVGDAEFDLTAILRPLIYVPSSMPLRMLLQKMQSERSHMALVIDEYGGVDGLATFEDIIETLVGDILDEHDTVEGPLWVQESPLSWLVEATAEVEGVENAIGLKLRVDEDDEDLDTIGGLAYLRAGRVPVRGEQILHESGVVFEVLEVDRHRILKMRLKLPEPPAEAGSAS